jgi:uncharacterized protein (TIGR03084 family)
MPADIPALLADLDAETDVVEHLLETLDDTAWESPTPAAGWAIRDQVSHLAYFDETATLAATDPDRFRAEAAALTALGDDFAGLVAENYRNLSPEELFQWFRRARQAFLTVFRSVDPGTRLPWYGPDMSPASSITARLMETWAHGQDIADTLGASLEPTRRLWHIARLGVGTLAFSFTLHGRPVPTAPVRVILTAPDRDMWSWGPPEAANTVYGPALDFCLVVTQRRNVADTALDLTGPVATEWMTIAQAFAGPPGPGRPPGRFPGARHA